MVRWILVSAALVVAAAPAPASAQSAEDRDTVALTLAEAEARALDRNPTLTQARLGAELADYGVAQALTAYTPVFGTTVEQRSQTTAATSQLTGGAEVVTDFTTYEAGVSQALPWGGGQLSVDFANARTETSNVFSTFNPSYSSTINATFTQPLLRGFTIDSTRAQVDQAAIALDTAGVRLTRQEATTLAAVRLAYWELVYATDALETARRSEDLARRQLEENRLRVELGTLAQIDVLQSEAELATRTQATVQADGTWRTSMVALKQLIVASTADPIWRADILPADRPDAASQPIDMDAAVEAALSSRTDIREAQFSRQSADLDLRLAENERLWAVDLVAGFTGNGRGGTQVLRESSALGGSVIGTVPGGYLDALGSLATLDYPTWRVGLNVSVPLGTSRAEVAAASARVEQRQADAQIQALELQVAADVTRAAERVRSAEQQMQAADVARQLADQRLQAEDARLDVGLSTTFLVLQAQRDLATAETNALRAALDYRTALVDFELAQVAP